MRTPFAIRPGFWAALTLLVTLLAGFVGHGLHHLGEHACEEGSNPHHDACAVCASLHASTPADATVHVAAPARAPQPCTLSWSERAPAATARRASGARAPPVA